MSSVEQTLTILTPRPRIVEHSTVVKTFSASCRCGKRFNHRDKKTLEHNLDEHLARYHGVENEKRLSLEYVSKRLRQIQNRMHGT